MTMGYFDVVAKLLIVNLLATYTKIFVFLSLSYYSYSESDFYNSCA